MGRGADAGQVDEAVAVPRLPMDLNGCACSLECGGVGLTLVTQDVESGNHHQRRRKPRQVRCPER